MIYCRVGLRHDALPGSWACKFWFSTRSGTKKVYSYLKTLCLRDNVTSNFSTSYVCSPSAADLEKQVTSIASFAVSAVLPDDFAGTTLLQNSAFHQRLKFLS